jgi:hypothetical protein
MKISQISGNPKTLLPIENLRFRIDDFAELKEPRGKYVTVPSLRAHGFDCGLRVFPRGDDKSPPGGNYMSIHLTVDGVTVPVDFEVFCKLGRTIGAERATLTKDSQVAWPDFIKRDKLTSRSKNKLLVDGALVIDVELRVYVATSPVWYPKPVFEECKSLLADLFHSASCADAAFMVGDQRFDLHRCILAARAPVMFQMINTAAAVPSSVDQPPTPVVLADVDAATFRTMVRFIYTGEWPDAVVVDDAEAAKLLLITAHRFGITRLKLFMESVIVDKHLDEVNAAAMLLLGDVHSCALLKEAAIQIFKHNADAVMSSKGWERIKESNVLLAELFATSNRKHGGACGDGTDPAESVAAMRNQLEKLGRPVDGSREMLLKRLRGE